MNGVLIVLVSVLIVMTSSGAQAACDLECRPDFGTNRRCDVYCTGATCNAPSSLASCDVCAASGAGTDGYCTICATDGTTAINGSSGPDVICMAGNSKSVDSKAGADHVTRGLVYDTATSTALTSAAAGNYNIITDSGNDFIITGDGDDTISSGTGADVVIACGGRNTVRAGSGGDVIAGGFSGVCDPADDVVGSLYCGETDNDTILGQGPAHQCMDPGADQSPLPGYNDCTYEYEAVGRATPTAFDVGTGRNCASKNVTMDDVDCGCD